MDELALVILVIGLNNAVIFLAYALLFSNTAMARAYAGARRFFEFVFALLSGFAGIRILMLRLTPWIRYLITPRIFIEICICCGRQR